MGSLDALAWEMDETARIRWRPALTAAAAWRDVEAAREGEGVWVRRAAAWSVELERERAMAGDAAAGRDGGSEFRSGAIFIF